MVFLSSRFWSQKILLLKLGTRVLKIWWCMPSPRNHRIMRLSMVHICWKLNISIVVTLKLLCQQWVHSCFSWHSALSVDSNFARHISEIYSFSLFFRRKVPSRYFTRHMTTRNHVGNRAALMHLTVPSLLKSVSIEEKAWKSEGVLALPASLRHPCFGSTLEY